MEKQDRRFDEGFDNILIYDYDTEYQTGKRLTADSFIMDRKEAKTSLNGEWHFAPDVFNSLVRTRWFDETRFNRDGLPIPYDFSFDEWDTVKVPGVWNAEKPEYKIYEGPGVYVRNFCFNKKADKKVFLKIGAANYETRIWLNKQYLGRHLGGFTPMVAEVTGYLKADGEPNRLVISVDNTRKGSQVPSRHYDWFNYGGIYRNVELIETPEVFIQSFSITVDRIDHKVLRYRAVISGQAESLEVSLPELGICQSISCASSTDVCIASGDIRLPADRTLLLWSPDHPKLYEIACRIGKDGDQVSDMVGFRTIETNGELILLNGEPVFLKGMCVHEESFENQRAVTDEDIRKTITDAKELGCNFLRLTHYPHHEMMAKEADRMGIMLLEEIPVYWALEFSNPATYEDASNQLKELIRRDINRASVIIWSIGNENPDSDERYHFMKNLAWTARIEDASRLIGASCLIDLESCQIKDRLTVELDVVGINEYYGWYIKDFDMLKKILDNSCVGKPVIITETGADAVSDMYSDTNEIYSEECQAEIYQKQFEILSQYSYIRGVTPWVLYDYASMRRMSHLQKGYNIKGVISADRRHKKRACDVIRKFYQKRIL